MRLASAFLSPSSPRDLPRPPQPPRRSVCPRAAALFRRSNPSLLGRRLVYAIPASEGALGSAYRVHTTASINHHFQVVRGFLRDEAAEALGMDERQLASVEPG